MYREFADRIRECHYLEPWGMHGIPHVKRVLYLAERISSGYDLTDEEKTVLALAACYHDIGRVHNGVDRNHGELSCRKLTDLGVLDKERLSCAAEELVLRLISAHCRNDSMFDGTERERLLFYMLKDADGLDRVRIFDLDPRYLRLEASRKRTEFAWELLRDENWKAAALAAE